MADKETRSQFSLLGCVQVVQEIALQWDARATKAELDFRSKHMSECSLRPELRQLPYPVQKLLVAELWEGQRLVELGEDIRELTDDVGLYCDCLFFRSYQLPCRHVFQQDMLYKLLRPEHWEAYYFMFEDCGMEVYEVHSKEYICKDIFEEAGAPARRKLAVRETLDQLRSAYHRLEEQVEEMEEESADAFMNQWINGLVAANGDYIRTSAKQLVSSMPQLAARVQLDVAFPDVPLIPDQLDESD